MEAAKVLNAVFSNKYSIWLDHHFLADHGDFHPQALFTNLVFELTLAPPSRVVKGSDASKLVYKLTNIQLQYETICSKTLADEATSVYFSGKAFAYDYVLREEVVTFTKKTDSTLNIRVNPQRRLLNGILLLFIEPYAAGARYSEKYVNLDIKVSVTMKGSPNNVYNNGFEGHDM